MIATVVVIVVATVAVVVIMTMIVVIIMVMVVVTPVFVVMFVRVPISPAGGIMAVVVAVTLIVTVICRSRSRGERHGSETNDGGSGEGNYCLAEHGGFSSKCAPSNAPSLGPVPTELVPSAYVAPLKRSPAIQGRR